MAEIGYLLGWDKSKVSRKAKKLFSLGLWTERGGRTFVRGFDIRDNFAEIAKDKKIVDLQEHVAISQQAVAEKQPSVVKMPRLTPKGNGDVSPKSVVILQQLDSKATLVSFKSEFNVCKSEEEYRQIWNEMGSPLDFTIDDMK